MHLGRFGKRRAARRPADFSGRICRHAGVGRRLIRASIRENQKCRGSRSGIFLGFLAGLIFVRKLGLSALLRPAADMEIAQDGDDPANNDAQDNHLNHVNMSQHGF